MSSQNPRPSIILVHGAFADGSSWNKVIPILEAEGFAVTAVQNPLKSLADDVATTKRGLESWQKLRTEEMLHAHLDGNITIKELATACSLSASHFGRCFRQSFGTSVHQHLIQLRIDKAKDLLSQTNKTLVEIALVSGFYDQAAFSRTFSRIEHMTPSRWRRFNRDGTKIPRRNKFFSVLMVGNNKSGAILQDALEFLVKILHARFNKSKQTNNRKEHLPNENIHTKQKETLRSCNARCHGSDSAARGNF